MEQLGALGGQLLGWASFADIALLCAMVNFVVTVAVMRFFEYDECVDTPPAGTPELHPRIVAARNRETETMRAAEATGAEPSRDGQTSAAAPNGKGRRSLRPADDGGGA